LLKTIFALALLGIASRASACAVCGGQSDAPMARGMTLGILFLLVVVGGVLGGITAVGVFFARRAAALGAEPTPTVAAK
jgi:hypothetical protein